MRSPAIQPAKKHPPSPAGISFAFQERARWILTKRMSNFDSDSSPDNEWDDRGDLAWNEFDWERYLREQDESIHRYLRFYQSCRHSAERIDAVAEKMGWGRGDWNEEANGSPADDNSGRDAAGSDDDIYTLHKNPIFIATKAISLGLKRSWESLATDSGKVPQPLALQFLAALHRAEEQASQAIHALDFGDYAMAVSLFKRALSALNGALGLLTDEAVRRHYAVLAWRGDAMPQLFDLREIWLRVMAECRAELDRPVDEEN
jgi:hypothetical protein